MSDIVGEIWRPIPGIEGYEVSDHGRVRSIDRWVQQSGRKDRWFPGTLLAPQRVTSGYLKVMVGKGRQQMIHQLVTAAFLGPCPDGMEVAHNDGNKHNNRLSNLRYDTRAGNFSDKRSHGTHIEGESMPWAQLTAADAAAIYALRGTTSAPTVAAGYNCGADNIYAIWRGRSWRSVTGA